MGFRDTLSWINNGEPGNATVFNRPLKELLDNTLFLQQTLESIVGKTANLILGQPCDSAVQIGSPVAWQTSSASFVLALAGSLPALGVCRAKSSATLADIVLGGFDEINLTASTGSASPAAGFYYLSQTTAGQLSSVRPSTGIQQPVLFADGQGGVYVVGSEYLPLPGPQGVPGNTGSQGPTGSTGAKGDPGPASIPPYQSGRWYGVGLQFATVFPNSTFPQATLIAAPFIAPGGATIDNLAVKVIGAGAPGGEGRLGVYSDNGSYYPGDLLSAANGTINGGSVGPKIVSIPDTVIAAGALVWLVATFNQSDISVLTVTAEQAWAFKGRSDLLTDPVIGYTKALAYGPLPSTFPIDADEITSIVPFLMAKVK